MCLAIGVAAYIFIARESGQGGSLHFRRGGVCCRTLSGKVGNIILLDMRSSKGLRGKQESDKQGLHRWGHYDILSELVNEWMKKQIFEGATRNL